METNELTNNTQLLNYKQRTVQNAVQRDGNRYFHAKGKDILFHLTSFLCPGQS